MQHFVNFGTIDFGYVKAANKQLKRITDVKNGYRLGVGIKAQEYSNQKVPKDVAKRNFDGMLADSREAKDYDLDPLRESVKSSYIKKRISNAPELPKEGWSDIRKTDDRAASPSGYLGFRTDPHQGYGGMMEEPIPKEIVYPLGESRLKKQYISRLTGRTL